MVPELISPGRVLSGRYHLVEPLARGGMATVWVADDPVLSRRVAVKILRDDLAADLLVRDRFRGEAIAAARLAHPNVVSTFDTGDDDGIAYIVMELVPGPTLRQLIRETGGLPVAETLRIGAQVADALDAAHRAGLVHRDVKPANVLVPPSGPVKVTDFGIAKAAGVDDLTRTGTVMGTARYLAPEQVHAHTIDARTDIYALGLLLFEMLCGHPPFGGESDVATAVARLTTSAPAIRTERPDVPLPLDDLVHRCLARRPEARPATAGEVRDDLVRIGSGERAPATPARPPVPAAAATHPRTAPAPAPVTATAAPRRRGSGFWWAFLVVVVAIAAGVAAFLLVRDDSSSPGSRSAATTTAGPIAIAQAAAFDPFGTGGENDEQAPRAIDGDLATSWSTETYTNFSRDKPGVGLTLDLGEPHAIRSVTVDTDSLGWSASIYVADEVGAALPEWGKRVASGADLARHHVFRLPSGTEGGALLVWLTALPRGPAGDRLQIAEVQVG